MKSKKYSTVPLNVKDRVNAKPIICYPVESLKETNLPILHDARKSLTKIGEIIIPPRDAKIFEVKKGQFFRIECLEGPQVGDLNLILKYLIL